LSAIVLSCLIAGCAFEGKVVGKRYEPAERRIQIYDSVVSDGTKYMRGKLPVCVEDDEDFIIIAENGNTKKEFYIKTKKDFDSINEGGTFRYDPKIAEEHDPLVKKRLSKDEYMRIRK